MGSACRLKRVGGMNALTYAQWIELAQYAKGRITRGWLMTPEEAYAERYLGVRWEAPRGL